MQGYGHTRSAAEKSAAGLRASPPGGKSARFARKLKKNIVGYLYVMPVILGVLIFTAFPVLYAFAASFFEGTLYFDDLGAFVGLRNYVTNFAGGTDSRMFFTSLRVTFVYAITFIPVSLVLGFLLAVFLNRDVKGMRFFRVLYYLPVFIPPVCSGMLWSRITDPDWGLINGLLQNMGMEGLPWFTMPSSAMASFIFVNLFGLGGNMILWLAQLKNVPKALYESARIDGAGKLRQLVSITVPMCGPMILYNVIMSIIGVLQTYSQVLMLVGGSGPGDSLLFYVFNVYNNRVSHFGYACALSFILFAIIALLTLLVMKTSRWVYYTEEG